MPGRDRRDQEEHRRERCEAERDEGGAAVEGAAAAEQEREAEHEQEVPDHAPGQRAAHDLEQAPVHGDQRDDQLGGVAEVRSRNSPIPGPV